MAGFGRYMEICNYLHNLEKMVEGDDGVEKHEKGLGNFQNIL